MKWIDETIRDFGRGMGIEGLSLNEEGIICLAFEAMGTLYIEKVEEAMIVYLAKEIDRPEAAVFEKALDVCHYRRGLPLDVTPGFKEDNQLVFVTRMPQEVFSLPQLEKAVNLLAQLHDSVFKEGR